MVNKISNNISNNKGIPTFLLSTERSGSNLVRSILSAHPEITAPHPIETVVPFVSIDYSSLSKTSKRKLIRDILILKHLSSQPLVDEISVDGVHARLEQIIDDSLYSFQSAFYDEYAATVGKSRWVSKDPRLWERLDEVRDYYNEPDIIYLVRDPRDVALSFKTSDVGRYHPYYTAKRWAEEQRIGQKLIDDLSSNVFNIRYRDLLTSPESVLQDLCSFLGTEYAPEMLYFYETEDAQAAAKNSKTFDNLSVPIKSDNFDKYKNRLSPEEVKVIEHLSGDLMDKFGYERQYDPEEVNQMEIKTERYAREDKKLTNGNKIATWKNNIRQKVKEQLTESFTYFITLRYGVLKQ